jgi:hypothetical protein
MQEFKNALFGISRVTALGLGGSRGLGIADGNSDYDFVLFRNGGEPIAPKLIVDTIKPFAEEGSIKDEAGFVRLQLDGEKIDIFQKDLFMVENEINLAKAGKFHWSIRQLFPHGDLSTCQISHITHLELCAEKNQSISNLRKLAEPFPLMLMNSLINTFMTQASITLIHVSKIKKARDSQPLIALCSAFFFHANIVLFAANKTYPVLERGANELISKLAKHPENYNERILKVFQACLDGNLEFVIAELINIKNELQTIINDVFANLKTVKTNTAN